MARRPGPVLGRRSRARRWRSTSTAVPREAGARGGAGGIALTHDHPDHAGAAALLRERRHGRRRPAAPPRRRRGSARCVVLHTGGHAPDHVAFVAGAVAFTGRRGARPRERLRRARTRLAARLPRRARAPARARPRAACARPRPARRPTPGERLAGYVAHRLDRERRARRRARRRPARRRRAARPRVGRRPRQPAHGGDDHARRAPRQARGGGPAPATAWSARCCLRCRPSERREPPAAPVGEAHRGVQRRDRRRRRPRRAGAATCRRSGARRVRAWRGS